MNRSTYVSECVWASVSLWGECLMFSSTRRQCIYILTVFAIVIKHLSAYLLCTCPVLVCRFSYLHTLFTLWMEIREIAYKSRCKAPLKYWMRKIIGGYKRRKQQKTKKMPNQRSKIYSTHSRSAINGTRRKWFLILIDYYR